MMIWHLFILISLVFAAGVLEWNLRRFRKVPLRDKAPPGAPKISILVPARNEAHRISPCARSLAAQQYPDFEVIILDDASEDGTGEVVRQLGYGDTGPLRIMRGEPLPPGWTGKAWASRQLAAAATGDYLLFTDADTEHRPEMLASAITEALATRADLFSAWPRALTLSWSEICILPVFHLAMILYPQGLWLLIQDRPEWLARIPKKRLRMFGGANGQFLLFRREAFLRIGGFEAVRNHLVEDLALGRAVASRAGEGMRLINADGSSISSVRMYSSLPEIWEGFTKNGRAAFEDALPLFLLMGTWLTAAFLLPFIWIFFATGAAWWLVLAQIVLIFAIRARLTIHFRTPWASLLAHPFGQVLMTAIALNSWRRSAGSGVTWKGRVYDVDYRPEREE